MNPTIHLVYTTLLLLYVDRVMCSSKCNPRLPHCRVSQNSKPYSNRPPTSTQQQSKCKPKYLIPGKAVDCTKTSSQKVMYIDPKSVVITPNPIKIPGCFTLEMTTHIKEQKLHKSFFAKIEYTWWNLPQFSQLPCQNATANGCGGYGNNCYYCDICNSLKEVGKKAQDAKSTSILSQFKDVSCPTETGSYKLKKQFCFHDFGELDKDGNCELDFIENDQIAKIYKDAFQNLQQLGYVSAFRFRFATTFPHTINLGTIPFREPWWPSSPLPTTPRQNKRGRRSTKRSR
ncbi:hypothetical protein T4E_3140 [Trichinella pseudospiralis]|uniref:Uncharacterized protein n=2 Tax=Trichinella pseudospiralis TaxID=6337 RepID=A0A0V0XLN8_TRIPS|nr:hypothetical protein T4E_3140 [Trichinella pseudospiralis]